MKAPPPGNVVAFARAELSSMGVRSPSRAALLYQARQLVVVGLGCHAGLHLCSGVVRSWTSQGEVDGYLEREGVITVAISKAADVDQIRRTVAEWLRGRVIVRCVPATLIDRALAWWAWIRSRRSIGRLLDDR